MVIDLYIIRKLFDASFTVKELLITLHNATQVTVGQSKSSHDQRNGVGIVFLGIHQDIEQPVFRIHRALMRNVHQEIAVRIIVLDGLFNGELVTVTDQHSATVKAVRSHVLRKDFRRVIPEDDLSSTGILGSEHIHDFVPGFSVINAGHTHSPHFSGASRSILTLLPPSVTISTPWNLA